MLPQTEVKIARTGHFPPRRHLCHRAGPMRRSRKRLLHRRVHRLSTTRLNLNQHLRSSCRLPRISNLKARLGMAHHLISWLKVLSDQHGFVLINLSETFFFPGISTFDSKGSHILVCSPVYHPMHFFSSLILMASGALNGFHDVCFCSTHFLCFFFFLIFGPGDGVAFWYSA